MRPHALFLLAAAAAACTIEPLVLAGIPCRSSSDCGDDPAYRCTDVDGGRLCLAPFPPEGERDAGVRDAGPPVYWCGDVELILATYCAGCHVPGGGTGRDTFRLDRYESDGGVSGAKDMARSIKAVAAPPPPLTPLMPPDGSVAFPDDEARARLGAWADQGAPFCADGGAP